MKECLFNKFAVLRPTTIKKETPRQVFSCEYCEIFKSTYFEEHLRATVSVVKISSHLWPNNYKSDKLETSNNVHLSFSKIKTQREKYTVSYSTETDQGIS